MVRGSLTTSNPGPLMAARYWTVASAAMPDTSSVTEYTGDELSEPTRVHSPSPTLRSKDTS